MPRQIPKPRTRPRLLCVDDEPQVLEGLKLLLGRSYDLHLAKDASEALELLEAGPFPVVISDMRMPAIDGAQFLERVAARWPCIVRIMLSGAFTFRVSPSPLREDLVFRFLSKPCEPNLLRETIAEAFALHEKLVRDSSAPSA